MKYSIIFQCKSSKNMILESRGRDTQTLFTRDDMKSFRFERFHLKRDYSTLLVQMRYE